MKASILNECCCI